MSKKIYFLIVDTETTMRDRVADFGAVVCDKKGRIVAQCAILVSGIYGVEPLFYISSELSDKLWSKQGKDRRFTAYENMLESGARVIASSGAINRWLDKALTKYNPILTAYNLAFDLSKCNNSGIDLSQFTDRFCLWHAAADKWGASKEYKNFILQGHWFNPPTDLGNMSYKTNAEVMTRFVLNNLSLEDEPHTALEDILFYEKPILDKLVKGRSRNEILTLGGGYNWRNFQVRDHYTSR